MQKAIIFSNRAVWPYVTLQCFWRFGCGFFVFVFCFVLFAFLAFCWVLSCSFGIVTAYWTVYWSYFSTAFAAHLLNKMDEFQSIN